MMAESKISKFKVAEFKMAAIIKLSENEWVWSQIELVWVRVRVEWECFCVNLRNDNKVSKSKMAVYESNMTEFKMAAIIKLSQNEWVKCFVQMVGTNLGKCEWLWKKILRWQNPRWPNSRWPPSSSSVRMNEWSFLCKRWEPILASVSEFERKY